MGLKPKDKESKINKKTVKPTSVLFKCLVSHNNALKTDFLKEALRFSFKKPFSYNVRAVKNEDIENITIDNLINYYGGIAKLFINVWNHLFIKQLF